MISEKKSIKSQQVDLMGRKYTRVKIFFNDNSVENLNAFMDSGSDLTIISTKVARKLRIKIPIIER